ncbi:DNA-binding transcriptional MocR family regulator [Acidovorax soli]|uniref:DNA-binding transcriptional MocR family regulator n=1 Tax=Acidovorax soli TaxID=592050 RepID=A0A7X0U9P9_9BURK|nr:PLP-dependent aminotransferase family protein [Acidovorax soli]MBB6560069.1 DNA-binding transcriptional MocR family regulator [Acidovorax soli]
MAKNSSVLQHSYLQLAQQLRRDIARRRYAPGERLPSVRALAAAQGVSVDTVVRCYRHLEALGVVQARHKSGMYVAELEPAGRAPAVATAAAVAKADNRPAPPPPVELDRLVSLEHRMTQLYALTTQQPLQWGLHLANAAPAWYPTAALARIAQRLLRSQPEMLGTYPTGSGLPALRSQLAAWMAGYGLDLQPQELMVTHGSTEALNVALRAVARPGDAVVVESPVYFGLLQMLGNLGLRAIELPCTPSEGMGLEALEYVLEHESGVRAVVVMPNFQNPLGHTMPERNKRRLLRLVEQHDLALIEDDVFGDLSHTPHRPQPVKAWDRHGRVIYCGSSSKSLAPAFRLGWAAGGRWHARMESLKLSTSLAAPWLEQAVLAEFLRTGGLQPHLRKLRERLAQTTPRAAEAVQRHFPAGTRVHSPAGGWWLWLELPQAVDALALLRLAVGQGIAFTPGVLFSTTAKYAHYLRLNIARPWTRELEQAVRVLGQLAGGLQHAAGAASISR